VLAATLDLIAIRESFKYWLLNRFSKTLYALNRDPIVKMAENVRCINDKESGCTARDPDGLFRTIKSPGVREKDKGLCNATYCRGWCPPFFLDREQVADGGPIRLIIFDWFSRVMRAPGFHQFQISVTSLQTSDDPMGYKLMSLRNALVEALNSDEPPTAKAIPLYTRTNQGYVRPYMENHQHIKTDKSYITPSTMYLTPDGNEKMMRQASAQGTPSDLTSYTQISTSPGNFIFPFKLIVCQCVGEGSAFW
jgi:hypothetical protein